MNNTQTNGTSNTQNLDYDVRGHQNTIIVTNTQANGQSNIQNVDVFQ